MSRAKPWFLGLRLALHFRFWQQKLVRGSSVLGCRQNGVLSVFLTFRNRPHAHPMMRGSLFRKCPDIPRFVNAGLQNWGMRSQIVFGAAIDRSAILHAAVAVAGFLSARSWTVTLTDVGERFCGWCGCKWAPGHSDWVDATGGWHCAGLETKKEQRVKKE